MPLLPCSECLRIDVPGCVTTINIELDGITDANNWLLTDKHGNRYRGDVKVDDGVYYIDVADLPAGLLNPFAGTFKIQFFEADSNTPLEFTVCEEETTYTCLFLDMVNEPGTETVTIPACGGGGA